MMMTSSTTRRAAMPRRSRIQRVKRARLEATVRCMHPEGCEQSFTFFITYLKGANKTDQFVAQLALEYSKAYFAKVAELGWFAQHDPDDPMDKPQAFCAAHRPIQLAAAEPS